VIRITFKKNAEKFLNSSASLRPGDEVKLLGQRFLAG